jgi:hypothetical protein
MQPQIWEDYFVLHDIEKDFLPRFRQFYSAVKNCAPVPVRHRDGGRRAVR